jgi:hypothetical protein
MLRFVSVRRGHFFPRGVFSAGTDFIVFRQPALLLFNVRRVCILAFGIRAATRIRDPGAARAPQVPNEPGASVVPNAQSYADVGRVDARARLRSCRGRWRGDAGAHLVPEMV